MQPLSSVLFPLLGQQSIAAQRFAAEATSGQEAVNLDPRLLLALAAAAISIGIYYLFRRVTPRTLNDDKLLFAEICSRHHLSGRQQKLLLEIAEKQQVACPSELLIDASLWGPDEERPPRWESPQTQDELLRLRSLLFTHPNPAHTDQLPA